MHATSSHWKFAGLGRLLLAAGLCTGWCAAQAEEAKEQAKVAAVSDGVSTAVGLAAGAVEVNPLGPLLAIGMKTVVFHYAETLPDVQRPAVYAAAASFWGGATANNVCVTAAILSGGSFAPACVALGVAWGLKTWQASEHERQFWEGCASLRQYAGLPDLPCIYTPPQEVVAQLPVAMVTAQGLEAP